MRKNLVYFLIICIFSIIGGEKVSAQTQSGTWGGIDWTLDDNGTLTISPTKGEPVPDESGWTYEVGQWREAVIYNSNKVASSIGGWPYNRSDVKKLIIEEGVTSIGSFTAQGYTNLTGEVIIPSTVTYIGQECFKGSTFTEITFAEGGTGELCIAQGAFKNLIVEEIAFPADRPSIHLHAWMFTNSANLKTIIFPANVTGFTGAIHVDYNHNPNAGTGGGSTSSQIVDKTNSNLQTLIFGSEEVRKLYLNTADRYKFPNEEEICKLQGPTNVTATASGYDITLQWNTVDNVDNIVYNVYKDGILIAGELDKNTTSYTVTGLALSTQHCFSVSAVFVTEEGKEEESAKAEVCATTAQGVAKVGNTEYATIDEAIANWTNNTTLTLLADVTLSDVITLNSTEHHKLNLSSYTMTAANGKNAINITANGLTKQTYILTIDADPDNPGCIQTTNNNYNIVNYNAGTKDYRPIILINNGIFNGKITLTGQSNSSYLTLDIKNGVFNNSISANKAKLMISNGVFHGSVGSQGSSISYRLISGGRFKSFEFMTADSNNTKFWIGTKMATSDVGLYVDEEGYLVVGGPVITNFDVNTDLTCYTTYYQAWNTMNDLLQYSSAKENGLYYESIKVAMSDSDINKDGRTLNIHRGTLDLTSETSKYVFNGTINLPNDDSEFTVKFKTSLDIEFPKGVTTNCSDQNRCVVSTDTQEGNITIRRYFLNNNDVPCTHVCRIDHDHYETFSAAYNAASNGKTITFLTDTEGTGITIAKNINIDFQNYSYPNSSKFIVNSGSTVTMSNGTINDIENRGTLTLENISLNGAEYVLTSKGTTYLNSTCTVSGKVEYFGGELYNSVRGVSGIAKKSFTGIGENQGTTGWSSISTPIEDAKIPEPEAGIHDLYRFNEEKQLWEFYKEIEESQDEVSNPFDKLSLGHGYLYTNKSNITFELEGEFNIDDVTLSGLSYTTDGNKLSGFHMVGNPFTHSITGNDFTATANLSDGFYVMQTNGAWLAQTLGTSIAPMSSVLIKLDRKADLTISNNKKRSEEESKGYIAIKAGKGEVYDMAYVSFNEGAGLDKINHRNEQLPMCFIPVEGIEYAIATMNEEVTEIPVSFKAPKLGEYNIAVEAQDCEFKTMVLIDNLTGAETDLLLEDYSFVARTDDNTNRFKILLTRKGDINENNSNFTYIKDGQMIFDNIEDSASVRIYDVMGRNIAEHHISGSASIPASHFAKGMYVVQMTDEKGVKVQKIVID